MTKIWCWISPKRIACKVCRSCEWAVDRKGKPLDHCIYGGPYAGYSDGTTYRQRK